jgi:hypothetical protein
VDTIAWLTRQQDSDGGFNFATKGGASDVDDTGAALEALAGTGDGGIARAVAFVSRQQNRDGGFPSQPGGASNAQSTAWAIQGLIASGASLSSLSRPLGYLRSLIGTNGAIDYSKGISETPIWVTAEAMMALAGKPLPLAPPTATTPAHRAAAVHHAAATAKPKTAVRKPGPRRVHRQGLRFLRRLAVDVGVLDALTLAPVG